ncbi:MAG TPA: 50S ribosomal protein L30 [Terriglobales bacterium]|jgi:large subunit ribosomal protein L30|nr:50S ribosomal protein L30 [Terriglobales bacterium]
MAERKKNTILLKWVRSAIAAPKKHKLVVKGLGFTRLNQVIEREDTPSIRGMAAKVPHLVQIVDGR